MKIDWIEIFCMAFVFSLFMFAARRFRQMGPIESRALRIVLRVAAIIIMWGIMVVPAEQTRILLLGETYKETLAFRIVLAISFLGFVFYTTCRGE